MFNYFTTWLGTYFGSKLNNEKGQGMIEYVLLVALIAIVLILVLTNVGTGITAKFQEVVDAL